MDFDLDKLLDEQFKSKKSQPQEEQTETQETSTIQQTQPPATTHLPEEKEVEDSFFTPEEVEEMAQPAQQPTKTELAAPTTEQKPEPIDVFEQVSSDNPSFDLNSFSSSDILEPDSAPPSGNKETILIAGEKNDGKSISALSFPGKIAVVAFDEKIFSARNFAVELGIKKPEDIMIYYPTKHYNPKAVDDREIGKAAVAVINEAFRAVYSIKVRAEAGTFVPDWILFDNLEFFIRLAEFAGKYKRGVPITARPEKGDDVWGAFDLRNIITNVIYKAAISIPKKGVIYTLYTKEKDVVMPDGTTKKVKTPKWFEVLMYETDHHILVWKDEGRYFAKIIATKSPKKYPDGLELEVTNIGFWNALQSVLKESEIPKRII